MNFITDQKNIIEFPEDYNVKSARPIRGIIERKEGLNTPCIRCFSHKTRDGKYPRIGRYGKDWRISKYIFHKYKEEVPEGMVVRHKCDDTFCINPDHLEIGWPEDNVLDKVIRGRQPRGEAIKSSKLKNEEAYYIKFIATETAQELAENYGVSVSTIRNIQNGKTWQWLKLEYVNEQVA